MVGLPIDDDESRNSLATKAAEAQLQLRIKSLQDQLRDAESALRQLNAKTSKGDDDDDVDHQNGHNSKLAAWSPPSPTGSITSSTDMPPVGKRGYLFRWMDRSIGWTGTKWALRFVSLDTSRGQISYFGSHLENQPRYVLSLRGCAVRDDGWKRNQRHKKRNEDKDPPLEEPGAYFFIFSIYQRPFDDRRTHVQDIVPLLRFSTPSMAEKLQWINLISETCAYCETDRFLAVEAERAAELEKRQREQQLMAVAMPEAKEGTLPPLYFAPHKQLTKHDRRPSFSKTPSSAKFRTKAPNEDAEKNDKESRGYPQSKPMHRAAGPSYLSVEAPVQNYRGFFNLGLLILIVSNVRLLVSSVRSHGFVWSNAIQYIKDLKHIRQDPWEEFPFVSGFMLNLIFITIAFCLEWLLSRRRIPDVLGMFLHHINAHTSLLVPLWIVWNFIDKPAISAVLLTHAIITWMKLISYVLANEDYRIMSRKKRDEDTMLALVEDLDPDEADVRYPENITLRNMFYFWFAPTLTYQIAFPKLPKRRWLRIGGILMRMVVCLTIFSFVAAQIVSPVLASLVDDLEASGGAYTASMMAEYWLKLSIANTYLWLLIFYFYFHLYLNLFAELLRFGDRVFYKDWWNSAEVSAYWRLWNMPVHLWLIRHVYFPCVRSKMMNKQAATLFVFFLSAVMHEMLVSVPFHMVRPWAFIGMMMQVPLVGMTKFLYRLYPGSSIGNMIFWLSFCVVGQPMAVMLYTVDFQYMQQHTRLQDECPTA